MGGTVVIVNPRSQGGRTERNWPRLREVIHEGLGAFAPRFTEGPGTATTLAREALRGGAELVVALGGDGTINEVVNGFFDASGPVSPGASLGVLPAGTGGDFIRTLGTPRDLAEAAHRLKAAPPRRVDVGRLAFVDTSGAPSTRHFINIASFGISGLVDKLVNRSSKALGGTLSFALATVRAGVSYKNTRVRLTLDGGPTREGPIFAVAVANGRFLGGGMKLAPHASLDDGWFDVITVGDIGLSDLLLSAKDLYTGQHLSHPKISSARARCVVAEPAQPGAEVLLDVDGEQPGRLPARFELLPGALTVRAAPAP